MKKWKVRLYFEQHVDVTVHADNYKDAIEEAYLQMDNEDVTLWSNRLTIQEPDVRELIK